MLDKNFYRNNSYLITVIAIAIIFITILSFMPRYILVLLIILFSIGLNNQKIRNKIDEIKIRIKDEIV